MDPPGRQQNVARDAKKTQAAHQADSGKSTVGEKTDCCRLDVTRLDGNTVLIRFGSAWLLELMRLSCKFLVPFRFYGTGEEPTQKIDRRYPRAFGEPIVIGDARPKDDRSGGRRRLGGENYTLETNFEELYATRCSLDEGIRLSDLLIVHKRAFTEQVVATFRGNQLVCSNQVAKRSFYERQALKPYPLLCVYFTDDAYEGNGYPRLCQVIFAAWLNDRLLKEGCPMEVVAREGFGSSIPATSDIGKGIRLDPGLLPPKHVTTVCEVLALLDQLLAQKKRLMACVGIKTYLGRLAKMGEDPLMAVDELMLMFARLRNMTVDTVLAALHYPKGMTGSPARRFEQNVCCEFKLPVPALLPWSDRPRDETPSGYGSESDDEGDRAGPELDCFVIRKAAFVSGMAAIQIIDLVGGRYVALQKPQKPQPGLQSVAYFEMDKMAPRDEVSHFNGAPNPRNEIHPQGLPTVGGSLVCTIDVTNLTTWEKGDFVCSHVLQCAGDGDRGKLLVLEESASKHPTGGDLVFGVVRVIGRRSAVASFFTLLNQHLEGDADGTTVLDDSEHAVRRVLQQQRLVARNRDLVQYVNRRLDGKSPEKIMKF